MQQMRIPPIAYHAVKSAIQQRRQLMMGERMQALNELLPALRHNARAKMGIVAPDPEEDDTRTKALKKKGLFEIAHMNEDEQDPEERDFVGLLIEEALRDFEQHSSHYRGVPPQVHQIAAARAEAAAGGKNAQDIAELRQQQIHDRQEAAQRFDRLEAGLGKLLDLVGNMAAKTPPATASTAPPADAAPADATSPADTAKKGQ